MDLPDLELPTYWTVIHWAIVYIAIGCALGFLEYTVAKSLMRTHPRRHEFFKRGMFRNCILINAAAWPGILVWLVLLGLMKGVIFYVERRRKR